MPDSENFLNQTFATEQFVTLTLLRRGGPRRARARLLHPSTTPLGRGYGSRLNPINSRAAEEKGKKKKIKTGQTSAPRYFTINRLARESSSQPSCLVREFCYGKKKRKEEKFISIPNKILLCSRLLLVPAANNMLSASCSV